MGQCLECDRSGWFLSLSANGLCKTCDTILVFVVPQAHRLIEESAQLINASKNLDTQLSRCDFILSRLLPLLRYEKKGIRTISPSPSILITKYQSKRSDLIVKDLTKSLQEAKTKAKTAMTGKAQAAIWSKLLVRIRTYQAQAPNVPTIREIEARIVHARSEAILNEHLNAAQKAQFKGQTKKALDNYYEALYFLRHDDIDDTLQKHHIETLEKQIEALGGYINVKPGASRARRLN